MRELDKVLDQNEKVFWEGSPSFWPYFVEGSFPSMIFGFFWTAFLATVDYNASRGNLSLATAYYYYLALIPLSLVYGILIPIYNILAFKCIYYAITDKRLIIQQGLIGRDFKVIDFDQVTFAEVDVGVFDKLFGGNTGTILISTPRIFVCGVQTQDVAAPRPYAIRSITNPYAVFKFFKKISFDVKTDISYPNKMRPAENPGYKTDYDPNKK